MHSGSSWCCGWGQLVQPVPVAPVPSRGCGHSSLPPQGLSFLAGDTSLPPLPVLAHNKGPRSPGSHPAAPAAAGVPGLSQLPSPAPRSSSCPRFPLCPAPQGLVWILHPIMGLQARACCVGIVPEAGSRTLSQGWFQRLDPAPHHGAVGTRLLHGHVSPSQPGSSTQHPMAQPAPGALPAPAPNPPCLLPAAAQRRGLP